jgi:hypothetical protein
MGAGVANATSGTADSRFERCQHAGHRHDRLTDAAAPMTSNLLIPAAMNVLFPSHRPISPDAVDNALKVSPENLLALRTRTNS